MIEPVSELPSESKADVIAVEVAPTGRMRHKDMTPEQKLADLRERQRRFRERNPERVKAYIKPGQYPERPPLAPVERAPRVRIVPIVPRAPRPHRLATVNPYTEEEKARHAEYMRTYRAKQKALRLGLENPAPVN